MKYVYLIGIFTIIFLLGGYTAGTLRYNDPPPIDKWVIALFFGLLFTYGFKRSKTQ